MKISDVHALNNRLSIAFLVIFLVVLILNLISCPLGLMISSSTDEFMRPFYTALTSGKPRWPYMLYSEAISTTFSGVAAGAVFWAVSLVLAYFFELRITKPILWLAIAIVSFCFGIWYYFLIPDVRWCP